MERGYCEKDYCEKGLAKKNRFRIFTTYLLRNLKTPP